MFLNQGWSGLETHVEKMANFFEKQFLEKMTQNMRQFSSACQQHST
jgi:hypothetical protein